MSSCQIHGAVDKSASLVSESKWDRVAHELFNCTRHIKHFYCFNRVTDDDAISFEEI